MNTVKNDNKMTAVDTAMHNTNMSVFFDTYGKQKYR